MNPILYTLPRKDSRHVYEEGLNKYSDRRSFFTEHRLVNQSAFFRLDAMFRDLQAFALPVWEDRGDICIYSAGCADGREAFSLGLFLKRQFQTARARPASVQIRGIDLNPGRITMARQADFQLTNREKLALQKYGDQIEWISDFRIRIQDELCQRVRFQEGDFLLTPNDRQFDLIVCTNVLFYYQPEFRIDLVKKLRNRMLPEGFIFLEGMGDSALGKLGLSRVQSGSHLCRIDDVFVNGE